MPVGAGQHQQLMLVTRTETGLKEQVVEAVHFVPMLGGVIS